MKFKRGINLVLKDNQNVVVPRGEFWRYSIFSGDRDGDFGVLANSNASGKGIYTQVCSAAGAKLKSAASIYITGAAFTAD